MIYSSLSADSPGAPASVRVREVTRSTVTLAWEPPEMDGGSAVRNYIIQKRDATRQAWNTVITKCSKTSCKISPLQEGCKYFFRVLAENEYGIGDGKDTEDAVEVSERPSQPDSLEVIYSSLLRFYEF